MAKSNKEIISELLEIVFEKIGGDVTSNFALKPALTIVKMKFSQMSDDDADFVVDTVHQISRHIEKETGILSKYHGIDV